MITIVSLQIDSTQIWVIEWDGSCESCFYLVSLAACHHIKERPCVYECTAGTVSSDGAHCVGCCLTHSTSSWNIYVLSLREDSLVDNNTGCMDQMHSSYVYILSCCMKHPRRRRCAPVPVPSSVPTPKPPQPAMDAIFDVALMFPMQAGMFPMKSQKISFGANKITKSCSLTDLPSASDKSGMFRRRRTESLWAVRGEIRTEFLRELKEKCRHPKYALLRALRKRKRVSRITPSGHSIVALHFRWVYVWFRIGGGKFVFFLSNVVGIGVTSKGTCNLKPAEALPSSICIIFPSYSVHKLFWAFGW